MRSRPGRGQADGDGVVEIAGIGPVDRDERPLREIASPLRAAAGRFVEPRDLLERLGAPAVA